MYIATTTSLSPKLEQECPASRIQRNTRRSVGAGSGMRSVGLFALALHAELQPFDQGERAEHCSGHQIEEGRMR